MYVCVCVCYWSLVRYVCPNHEVVMLQPRTVNTPKPRIIRLLLYSLLLNPPHPLLLPSNVLTGGQTTPDPPPHPLTYSLLSHGIIHPHGRHPYLSHHTEITSPPPRPSLSESDSSYPSSLLPRLTYSYRLLPLPVSKISSKLARLYVYV